ncbi:hypothetical protein Cyast_0721 [Cyanobacterium stanieri PCC 7202]|uniref:Ribbon-helix-helix protein CopG domain-containing protein n=1 Tax=Cyanobacterium stanieri (strain ATCC 29140 / PCC 7202) TaxID=292563 RepID=K9YIN5_CYASC|nr:hypothetical protein Cyast_0721 [Cyanobacterium stanieri PCC 7202]
MTGKTLSAHVDMETSERITALSKRENRSKSQIASTAIKLCSILPPNAWSALLQLTNVASKSQWLEISQDITRVLLHHQYQLAQKRIAENIDQELLNSLETEDDILSASIKLTGNV